MALLMIGKVEGLDPDTYDAINKDLGMPDTPPDGLLSHTAGRAEGGMEIVDVWESQEKFEAFMQNQLMPAMQKAGYEVPSDPQPPEQYELHYRWSS
jgi:hypothetical protein